MRALINLRLCRRRNSRLRSCPAFRSRERVGRKNENLRTPKEKGIKISDQEVDALVAELAGAEE